MAIKRRFVECECGEVFNEESNSQIEGNIVYTPWKLKGNRQRATKTPANCDILVILFVRSLLCGRCKNEILREVKQYELTPPISPVDEPLTTLSNREYIMSKANEAPRLDLLSATKENVEPEEDISEDDLQLAVKK